MKAITKYVVIGWSGLMLLALLYSACSGLSGMTQYTRTDAGTVGVVLGLMIVIIFWGLIWAVIAVPMTVIHFLVKS